MMDTGTTETQILKCDRRLICWCLYTSDTNRDSLRHLPMFIFGLRCNQRAARMFFPGWELRLYVDEHMMKNPYVNELCRYGEPPIEMVACRRGQNEMIERYRALLDDDPATIDACLVRDLDSVLSKTDADIVNAWLAESSTVLSYHEYKMYHKYSMGGGTGLRIRAMWQNLQACHGKISDTSNTTIWQEAVDLFFNSSKSRNADRGTDEHALSKFLKATTKRAEHTVISTRMRQGGTYCLFVVSNATNNDPPATILWPNTMEYVDYNAFYISLTKPIDEIIGTIVEYVKGMHIERELFMSHHAHHRDNLLKNNDWAR